MKYIIERRYRPVCERCGYTPAVYWDNIGEMRYDLFMIGWKVTGEFTCPNCNKRKRRMALYEC